MGLIIHVDGGSRGNPGPAGAGVVIRSEQSGLIHEAGYWLGTMTNNAAEYQALIRALQRAQRCGDQPLAVCSDSELLVRQITGQYRVKSPGLAPLYHQVQMLLLKVSCWRFQHVPREENSRADALANMAMDAKRDVIVFDRDAAPAGSPPGASDAVPRDGRAAARKRPGRKSASTESTSAARSEATHRPGQHAADASDFEGHAPADGDSAAGAAKRQAARAVQVVVTSAADTDFCPAGRAGPDRVRFAGTVPAGMCVHAVHALLPTVLAIQRTDPGELAAVPTMTVRCSQLGCRAAFHVSPATPGNGVGGA